MFKKVCFLGIFSECADYLNASTFAFRDNALDFIAFSDPELDPDVGELSATA